MALVTRGGSFHVICVCAVGEECPCNFDSVSTMLKPHLKQHLEYWCSKNAR